MILIAAPICEGKIYSINNWLEWIARQQYTDFDYCLCTESTSEEFINKLSQIEIINSGNIKKPIILINEEIIKIDNPIQKICNARETIRLYALENGYSHILFLDSDVVPIYMDTIQKLLDTNLDCVSGLYCYKNSYVPVAVSRKRGTNPTITDMEEANKKNQLIDCLVIGLGCALISRRVFSEIPFDFAYFGNEIGEDYGYCWAMENIEIPRYLDAKLLCFHLGETKNNRNDGGFFTVERAEK